jgi:hypothetical protein
MLTKRRRSPWIFVQNEQIALGDFNLRDNLGTPSHLYYSDIKPLVKPFFYKLTATGNGKGDKINRKARPVSTAYDF